MFFDDAAIKKMLEYIAAKNLTESYEKTLVYENLKDYK